MTSDELLASRSLNGDLDAFEELVNRFKNRVFALVYRIVGQQQEAEDVTQEVFLAVYEKLYQYDKNKKFAPWIFRIATNASISALRKISEGQEKMASDLSLMKERILSMEKMLREIE